MTFVPNSAYNQILKSRYYRTSDIEPMLGYYIASSRCISIENICKFDAIPRIMAGIVARLMTFVPNSACNQIIKTCSNRDI